jgi:hypothetical protein
MGSPSALAEPALTSHLLGRAVLQAAVRVLAPLGIPVMPLKGFWLQQFVYGEAGDRVITDVDVLVPEGTYTRARRALAAAGFRLCSANVSEAAYLAEGLPLPLDLHRRLFTRGAFRVSVAELFARGSPDETTFGVPVTQPDPVDVLVHLIGHALKSGTAWIGRGHELRDIPLLLDSFELSPALCAQRLEHTGLDRAARFVLPLTAADDPGSRARALLGCLRSDPTGAWLAECATRLRAHMADAERAPAWPGFALDSSVPRGAAAFLLRLWDKPLEHRRHERP